MKSLKLKTGFTVAFLMLMAVSAFALRVKSGEYRLVQPEEAALIRGGSGVANAVANALCPIIPASSPPVNITLGNIPYLTQYIRDPNAGYIEFQSNYYCGLASALMVRAKLARGNSYAPSLYNSTQQVNYSQVNTDLKNMDTYLKNGWYGSGGNKIDVTYLGRGLVYSGSGADWQDYFITTDILRGIYRGRLRGYDYDKDYISYDYGHVADVSMTPLPAYPNIIASKEISTATKAVWDHINTYNQPVVVIVDSNKQVLGGGTKPSSSAPFLHYIVIRGINENSSGGTRRFSVHDPLDPTYPLVYTEEELRSIMVLSSVGTNPTWVYEYGSNVVDPGYRRDPAYILTVQGD